MNENEMKERLAKGEDPLELSILKWEDIVYHGGEDMGFQNCALCDVYYRHDANDNFCEGCPVREHTGKDSCRGTPYENWDAHQDTYHKSERNGGWVIHCDKCEEIAKQEIEFLKSLRVEK